MCMLVLHIKAAYTSKMNSDVPISTFYNLTVAYLNGTRNVKLGTQKRRLEPTGLAQPGESLGLMDTGPGSARAESAGWVFLTGLEPNRPVFAVQTRTACVLPGPVGNTNPGATWCRYT